MAWGRIRGGNITATGVLAVAILASYGCADRASGTAKADPPNRPTAEKRAVSKPIAEGMNLLLVTLDTTRADYISCLGGDPRITPNLDALARRSVLFEHAWSETNVTDPSHLTIMTGLHAIDHGVLDNVTQVPERIDTLPQAMRRAGYETAGFVAVPHLGPNMGWRGFDVLPRPRARLSAAQMVDRATAWLGRKRTRPFFLWVHFYDSHSMYTPPPDIAAEFYQGDPTAGNGPPIASAPYFKKVQVGAALAEWLGDARDLKYPRAMYAAQIHYVDRELKRLFAKLDEMGHTRDTVIIVVADHGESMDEHGIYYDHNGLFEPQIRIPLIVHVPGQPASRCPLPVITLDIVPTLVELMGVEFKQSPRGQSLLPVLLGRHSETLARRTSFIHQNAHNVGVAIRDGDWKLIWPIMMNHPVLSPKPQLFNLSKDPNELDNLATAYPQRVAALRHRVEPWIHAGLVHLGTAPHLDQAALDALRSLGYLGD